MKRCNCNNNHLNGLSGGKNNPCGEIDIIGGELAQPNPLMKLIKPKIDRIIDYAKDQVNCNIKSIESSEWQKMIFSMDTSILTKKLEPAPINTIEFAKKEFIPPILFGLAGLTALSIGIGYYFGNKK